MIDLGGLFSRERFILLWAGVLETISCYFVFVLGKTFFLLYCICILLGVQRREGSARKSANLRAFQRCLLIVPRGAGWCIANEQLFLANATAKQEQVRARIIDTRMRKRL